MLCDKRSKDYLRIAPYQKDTAQQQAHKTETSTVCAHHPPHVGILKSTLLKIYNIQCTFSQIVSTLITGHVKFFDRGIIVKLKADIYRNDSAFSEI